METVSLRTICYALGFNATRPAKWIEDGYLTPSVPGGSSLDHELTKGDALSLLALADLDEAGLAPSHIYREVQRLDRYQTRTCLVISTGHLGRLIPSTPRGGPGASDEDCTPVHMPGRLYHDIVPLDRMYEVLADKQRHVTIILNLDHLKDRVDEAWQRAASEQP